MRNILKRKEEEEEKIPIRIPEFGEFLLERMPGGTLQARHSLGGEKFERVCMLYEKMPSLEHGRIHFKLERYADSGDLPYFDNLHVTFTYNRKLQIWSFDKWEGTLGKSIAPMQWEKMLDDFFTDKNSRKWLKDEETYGPPRKSWFQRLRLG